MDTYEAKEYDGMREARRTTLCSLYIRAQICEVETDIAAMKASLFQRDIEAARAKKMRLLDVRDSWKHQCRVLLDHGYAEEMHVSRADFTLRLAALAPAAERCRESSPHHFPYLIAIPHACMRISNQLALINTQQSLRDEDFSYEPNLTVPSLPYLIADVGAGFELQNVCAEEALALLKQQGRSPLTLEEITACVLQTAAPSSTLLDYTFPVAAGTRHRGAYVPDLYRAGKEPASGKSVKLKCETLQHVYAPAWSIPSCAGRVGT